MVWDCKIREVEDGETRGLGDKVMEGTVEEEKRGRKKAATRAATNTRAITISNQILRFISFTPYTS
jgi:hypothetical protein